MGEQPMDLEKLKEQAQQLLNVLPHPQASLVPLIRSVVQSEGCVSDELQSILAQTCDVPAEQVKELVLAYQSSLVEPENSLRVCGDPICILNGAAEIIDSLKKTGSNSIPFAIVDCPGYCHAAPVVQMPDGSLCRAVLTDASEQQPYAQPGYSFAKRED
jgi:NADH:ubiquinone oxidoreductase subunit E